MIMSIRHRVVAAVALMVAVTTAAQTYSDAPGTADGGRRWTLGQCISHALKHNIGVRQRENNCRQQELQLSTARNSRLPDLNAALGQNFSFGRGLTADNTYTNTNTASTSFSVSTSVPLFTGMNIPNTIRLRRLNLEAATADLERARDDIRVQVAQAYVEILYDMEIAAVARRQIAIDSMQTARLDAMLAAGKASEAEAAQQRATLAQSRLTATQADNNLRMALLTLTQLLELPSADGFAVARPQPGDEDTAALLPSPAAVFAEAEGIRPEIRAEQLRLQGAERNIAIARSALYPQLSLSAGMGTNYYKTSGFRADGFSSQLENNFSQYVGLNLSVPLFSRFQTRNNIRAAKIERETQLLQLDNARKTLYKEIQQACCNAVSAAAKCASSREAVAGSEAAFRLMTAKYENGKATVTEFNEAKNNYMKAESDLVQARYEYLFQRSLLDFYRGRPLDF